MNDQPKEQLNNPLIIGFTGKCYSGKSQLTEIGMKLCEKAGVQCIRLSFAGKLKSIALQMGWDGVKDNKGRKLLQELGTNVGRKYNENIWVNKMATTINEFNKDKFIVVFIDDVRFQNEVDYIHNNHGFVIRVKRSLMERIKYGFNGSIIKYFTSKSTYHKSENQRLKCDFTIDKNNDKFFEILRSVL